MFGNLLAKDAEAKWIWLIILRDFRYLEYLGFQRTGEHDSDDSKRKAMKICYVFLPI